MTYLKHDLVNITKIFLANYDEIASFASSTSDNEYDAVSMKTNPTTVLPYYWYEVSVKRNSASFQDDLVVNGENNPYVTHQLSMDIHGMDKKKSAAIQSLLNGNYSVAIVKTSDGLYHLLGRTLGMRGTSANYGSGKAAGDMYGGSFTLAGNATEYSEYIKTGTSLTVWDGTKLKTITLSSNNLLSVFKSKLLEIKNSSFGNLIKKVYNVKKLITDWREELIKLPIKKFLLSYTKFDEDTIDIISDVVIMSGNAILFGNFPNLIDIFELIDKILKKSCTNTEILNRYDAFLTSCKAVSIIEYLL